MSAKIYFGSSANAYLMISVTALFLVMLMPVAFAATTADKVIIFRDDDAQAYWMVDVTLTNVTNTLIQNDIAQTIGLIPYVDSAYSAESLPSASTNATASQAFVKAYAVRTAKINTIKATSVKTMAAASGVSSNFISFGADQDLKDYLNSIKGKTTVEIALHGFVHSEDEFLSLNYSQANTLISQGRADIYSEIGVNPVTFMPPYNTYNNNTLNACKNNNITRFSAATYTDDYSWKEYPPGLLHVPDSVEFYDWDTDSFRNANAIINDCQASLNSYNVCVLLIHPQEFTEDSVTVSKSRYNTLMAVINWTKQMKANGTKSLTIAQYGVVVKKANGLTCSNSTECNSTNCNNAVCCNSGTCGWLNGTTGMCIANNGKASNSTFNGICKNGTWNTELNGTGCNKFPCSNGTCVNNTCIILKNNGQKCSLGNECNSTNCNNGYCCNSGQCSWLNGTTGMCIANGGTASNSTLNGVCRTGVWKTLYGGIGCISYTCDSGKCQANNTCLNDTKKTNGASCINSTECNSSSCNNGYCCNSGSCGWLNGTTGVCLTNGNTASNTTFNGVCRSGILKTIGGGIGCSVYSCDNGTCTNNTCIVPKANGQNCSLGTECSSGACSYGYCCNSGQCGWTNGTSTSSCIASGNTAANTTFSGICRTGTWKTVYGGIGCNIYACDSGICQTNNTCLNATKKANGVSCSTSTECNSTNCNNGYCCNSGECGWTNGSTGTCIANSAKATNSTLNGICRSGVWKTVYNGIGCNYFSCDSGTCQTNNTCFNTTVTKKANGAPCASSTECNSTNCNNGYCCNSGQCGWLNGTTGMCISNSAKAINSTLSGICRTGVWKTVYGGIGCISYTCDSGKCQANNTCFNTTTNVTKKANKQVCSINTECQSNSCSNGICCDSGQCGLSSRSTNSCISSGTTKIVGNYIAVCRSGTWKIVYGGTGCNYYPCDSGTCKNNRCR